MGKFLSRFAIGAALGLLAVWLWGRLNQEDDGFDDDDDVIEIPLGNNKQTSHAASPQDKTDGGSGAIRAKVAAGATAPKAAARDNAAAKADGSAAGKPDNLEWVDGIGPAFNRILNEAGIKSDKDLAKASIEQLRATGINRNNDEFASWIEQARQRVGGK
jgi:predicted flap endonuclease-1-like 5' DNA nuclease